MAAEQTPGTPPPAATETPKSAARAPLADRMREAGWNPSEDEVSPAAADAEPDKGSGSAPKKTSAPKKKPAEKATAPAAAPEKDEKTESEAKTEPAAAPETDADKLGARGLLEKLAKEQGFVIEDGKVHTKERAEFRVLKQEQRKQLAEAEKAAIARVQEAEKSLAERFKRVEGFETAIKNRDHQALAKALGYDDWDKLQGDVIAWNADPSYQERLEMREKLRAIEEREEQAAQQRLQQQQQAEQQARETKYLGDLSGAMKASADPLVQSMSDDPLFLRAVYRIQQENWDGRETVTPEQAIRMAAQGSRVTLGEELKALHARLDKAFGKKPEPVAAKPEPKPKIAAAPKGNPSLPAAKVAGRTDRLRAYSERLAEATERDRKAGGARY